MHTEPAAMVRTRSGTYGETCVKKIDVKNVKKQFAPMDAAYPTKSNVRETERKLTPKGRKIARQSVGQVHRLKSSTTLTRLPKVAFDEADLSPAHDVFVSHDRPLVALVTPREPHKRIASYKLIRPTKRSVPLVDEVCPVAAVEPGSIVRFMQETLEDYGTQPQKKTQIKLLKQKAESPGSPNTHFFGSFAKRKEEVKGGDTPSRSTYSIKTPQSFRFSDRDLTRFPKEDKSRAERSWAWKGKLGLLGSPKP